MMKVTSSTTAFSFALLIGCVGLAGCAGGYGSGEPGATEAARTSEQAPATATIAPSQERINAEDYRSSGEPVGSSESDSTGQKLLLDTTKQRRTSESTTYSPDTPYPASSGQSTCEGYPGFDRGCPGGPK
jgi:hypothetical protein